MIKGMDQWEWSSYRATIGKTQAPDWLETDWLLSHFGQQRKCARGSYINFVRGGIGLPSIWKNLRKQIFLGNEAFVDQHQEKINEKVELDDIPALQKRAMSKPINYYQDKYKNENIAIKEAYLSGGYTMKDLGEHFRKHYTTISRIIKKYE